MFDLKLGQNILLIWNSSPENLKNIVENFQSNVGPEGKISLENAERLCFASFPNSSFDVVLSGVIFPQSVNHTNDLLGEILRIVKPNGKVFLQQATSENPGKLKNVKEFKSCLTISGFINVSAPKLIDLTSEQVGSLKESFKTDHPLEIQQFECQKPNFEVGSSVKLAQNSSVNIKNSEDIAAVWKLDDTMDDDIETIDPNNLLDDEDLKKPEPSSLRVCGTTGKRKACKDCSCGLAEELAGEQQQKKDQPKTSSCGNCYLGDAFRCASCPYLGMPAFKPGEKIQLTDRQLKADV